MAQLFRYTAFIHRPAGSAGQRIEVKDFETEQETRSWIIGELKDPLVRKSGFRDRLTRRIVTLKNLTESPCFRS